MMGEVSSWHALTSIDARKERVVGCGQERCSGRFNLKFDILRLTTRGLERKRRPGKRLRAISRSKRW